MIGKTINEITIGDSAHQTKLITDNDVKLFAEVTNDFNPVHFDEEYAAGTIFKKRVVHGMLVGSLFSKIFGMDLPGYGTIYITQSLRFKKPVYLEDMITATVIVTEIDMGKNRVKFDCIATNQSGEVVTIGEAILMPPKH